MTAASARSARLLALVALACVLAVGAALVAQYAFDMQPCPWCILQRLIFVTMAIVGIAGVLLPGDATRRIGGGVCALLAVCGMAAALWQHFRAAASQSCDLTLADRIVSALGLNTALPAVFEARASCADAAVNLLGVPFDVWSLLAFALLGAAALRSARRD